MVRSVGQVYSDLRTYDFHPLNAASTFTNDRTSGKNGIANLGNRDGFVRLIAIRDLVRQLPEQIDDVIEGLTDKNEHVRQISAAALGIAKQRSGIAALESRLRDDPSALVRAQAAMSLGQIEAERSVALLQKIQQQDSERDVQHQCELAIDQIKKQRGSTPSQLKAFQNLDPNEFHQVELGKVAPDFTLLNTENLPWNLKTNNSGNWVVLIWIFADWCPVCHGEFRELISMKKTFEDHHVQVATIECHDLYRCRVMVGKETDPTYWFSKKSFQDSYKKDIWWPHLSDPAGAIGAKYGVAPMSFAVHAEYINRPTTMIIDPAGHVRFAYYGTFWGDRPSIHRTLEMIKTEKFEFKHSRRLSPGTE